MESHNALLFFAGAHEDDFGGAYATVGEVLTFDFHLVGGDDWNAAPSDYLSAKEVDSHRGNAAPSALTLKRRNSTGIGDKECGLFPNEREKFV